MHKSEEMMRPSERYRVRLKDGRTALVISRTYVVEIGPWDENGKPKGGVIYVSDEDIDSIETDRYDTRSPGP